MDQGGSSDVKQLPISRSTSNGLPGVEAIARGDSFDELETLLAGAIYQLESAVAHTCV
jgi:hypothetical protein